MKIKAKCNNCGDVRLSSDQVRLVSNLDQTRFSYKFNCPSGDHEVERQAGDSVAKLLIGIGVVVRFIEPVNKYTPQQQTPDTLPPYPQDAIRAFRCGQALPILLENYEIN